MNVLRANGKAGALYLNVVFHMYVGGGGLIYEGEKVVPVDVNQEGICTLQIGESESAHVLFEAMPIRTRAVMSFEYWYEDEVSGVKRMGMMSKRRRRPGVVCV